LYINSNNLIEEIQNVLYLASLDQEAGWVLHLHVDPAVEGGGMAKRRGGRKGRE
jgi:hypothetical protein